MMDKLTLLVCEYFLQETKAALKDPCFKNIEAIAFATDCDRPLQAFLKADASKIENNQNNLLFGGHCLNKLQHSSSNNKLQISIKEQCFELLLPSEELNVYLDQGAHLFTPVMLNNWNKVNQNWKFTDSDRKFFFTESTNKLVLIDAGLNPSAIILMEQIANQLSLPWETKKITLEHLRYQLLQQVIQWRISLQSVKDKQLANYAMINDLISNMVTLQEEKQVIDQTLEVFHMFCAASNVCFLSIDEQNRDTLVSLLPLNNEQESIKQLRNQTKEYELDNDGFTILVKREQQILGIISIKEVAFPQYIKHYLNLARNIVAVIALAINNARIYQKQLAAEQEIRSLNSELNTQLDSVNALNHELETFTYSVSHDLRGPLRSLDGFSNILLRDYAETLDERGQGFLNRIRANAQRMGQLIDDLLRLSRLTRAELIIQPIDLSAIAIELSQDLQQAEPEHPVKFIIAKDLKTTGDFSLIKAVMENLIGNSWKYTSKCTSAEIEIGKQLDHDKVCFYIKDNGAGFDMSYADKLFAPFQRLHSAEDYPGTGIGLATVQRIIQRHRGKIWAESQPDKGACFYFTLGVV
jgi:signal transduction histidine kinase